MAHSLFFFLVAQCPKDFAALFINIIGGKSGVATLDRTRYGLALIEEILEGENNLSETPTPPSRCVCQYATALSGVRFTLEKLLYSLVDLPL